MFTLFFLIILINEDPQIISQPPQEMMFVGETFVYEIQAENYQQIYLNAHKDLTLKDNIISGLLTQHGMYKVTIVIRNKEKYDVQQFYIKVRPSPS